MDTLSDIVRLLKFQAGVFFHSTLCGSWNLNSSEEYTATYHFVTKGSCQIHFPSIKKRLVLRPGDLIVLPRNIPHTIQEEMVVQEQNDEPLVGLICGYFDFQQQICNPILDSMPEYLYIQSQDLVKSSVLDDLLRLMFYEAEASLPGIDLIVDNLSEVLFIYAIRTYIKQKNINTSYLTLLTDEKLQAVIKDIHESPWKPWSVASLANIVGMSRSAFAIYFKNRSSMTPMQYVNSFRMHYAYKALKESHQSVAQIAEKTGYTTEASFRKAFKNYFNIGPGAVRKK